MPLQNGQIDITIIIVTNGNKTKQNRKSFGDAPLNKVKTFVAFNGTKAKKWHFEIQIQMR